MLKEGIVQILKKVMEKCLDSLDSETKEYPENSTLADRGFPMFSWCLPALKSVSLLCNSRKPLELSERPDL